MTSPSSFQSNKRIVHLNVAPSTSVPLFKQAEDRQNTAQNYQVVLTISLVDTVNLSFVDKVSFEFYGCVLDSWFCGIFFTMY